MPLAKILNSLVFKLPFGYDIECGGIDRFSLSPTHYLFIARSVTSFPILPICLYYSGVRVSVLRSRLAARIVATGMILYYAPSPFTILTIGVRRLMFRNYPIASYRPIGWVASISITILFNPTSFAGSIQMSDRSSRRANYSDSDIASVPTTPPWGSASNPGPWAPQNTGDSRAPEKRALDHDTYGVPTPKCKIETRPQCYAR